MWQSFLIALQFLTVLSPAKQTVWTEADFGGSVRCFPLVGAVLGMLYALVAWILLVLLPELGFNFPLHIAPAILVGLSVFLTGGLHCDGFMDSCDGLLSGRSRERILEIMKDSRAGSFGVVGMVILLLFQYSVLLDMLGYYPWMSILLLFAMPVVGRLIMALAVSFYPYARKEGIGKAFHIYAKRKNMALPVVFALALLVPTGIIGVVGFAVAAVFSMLFANWTVKKIGGMTGDTYGAVCIMSETVFLLDRKSVV